MEDLLSNGTNYCAVDTHKPQKFYAPNFKS